MYGIIISNLRKVAFGLVKVRFSEDDFQLSTQGETISNSKSEHTPPPASTQQKPGLKRDLGKLQSYATIIGIFIGAGAFVVTARAGADTGPSVPLAYLMMGPIILATSVAYMVYLSTPLGFRPGGAYIHISRTFGFYYVGYIAMWMKLIAFLGAVSVLAASFGEYMTFFFPNLNQALAASLCLIVLYGINIVGVRYYGWVQTIMLFLLLVAVAILVIPGLFAVDLKNYSPFMPFGWSGFFKAMATLFFGYAGFETLAQTAGETKNPRESLPKVFFNGIIISVAIYFLIAFVAFGVLPYQHLAGSESAMADVAAEYLPFGGAAIVALGALMAFTTSINASILVPSRTLFVFAEDRILPEFRIFGVLATRVEKIRNSNRNLWIAGAAFIVFIVLKFLVHTFNLTAVSRKFRTPHVSLILCLAVSLMLIWTETIGYMLNVALQGIFILYFIHGLSLMLLPFVRRKLYATAKTKFNPPFLIICSLFSMFCIVWFSRQLFIDDPGVLKMIALWIGVGTVLFLIARWEGKRDGFDYDKRLVEEWQVNIEH